MNTRDVETRQKLIAFKSNVSNIFVDIETCSTLVETEYGCNVFTRTVDKSPREILYAILQSPKLSDW